MLKYDKIWEDKQLLFVSLYFQDENDKADERSPLGKLLDTWIISTIELIKNCFQY